MLLPAITLWQPWATLIALGEKQIETRSWATSYRGPLAIHAAQKIPPEVREFCIEVAQNLGFDTYPVGSVVAICELVGCKRIQMTVNNDETLNPQDLSDKELSFGDYTPFRFGWLLQNIVPLKTPIPAKGSQKIWNWNATDHQAVIDPWVIGNTTIWTPKGIMTGRQVETGTEDAVLGLEVTA